MTRIGVVGAGRWGSNIIRTLASIGALGAVCDFEPERLHKVAAEYPPVRTYSDLEDLLGDEGISAVAIASPVSTHYAVAKRVLEANRHAFVEKPMTMRAVEAADLVHIGEEKNLVLMVGHLLLYQPAIRFIKAFVREGRLGDVRSVHQIRKNLGTVRTAENVVDSLGVHDVAVLMHLFESEPDHIEASGDCIINSGIEDTAEVRLSFPGKNAVARVSLSWLWPIKDRRLVVYGTDGFLEFDETHQEVVHYPVRVTKSGEIHRGESETVFRASGEPLRIELEHFLDCVEHGKVPLSDGVHAHACVRVLERIKEQLREQRKK